MSLLSIFGMGSARKRTREEGAGNALPRSKARRQGDLEDGHDGLDELTAGGEVRAVEVDQKEFITKMLARYEGHYFCLRELMQNADDAGASRLTVKAYTAAGEGVTVVDGCVAAAAVRRMEVCNDGQAFTAADWKRVQTIAQGNPNEKTVGMFGVGFYSVFSLTDRPIVVSNGTAADMFYRGQQLYVCTKSSQEILERYGKETSIVLRMKEEKDFLLHELRQYLHDSIFFSRTLAYIRFLVDGEEVFAVEKECRPVVGGSKKRQPFDLLRCPLGGECEATFRDGELGLVVEEALVHTLAVSWSGLEEEEKTTTFTLVEAAVAVDATEEFRAGCRAVLSKNIERRTTVQVLVQEQSHLNGTASSGGLFYVGAPTGELTGGSLHVAAHLYPTMERIRIDLTHKYLSVWNSSLMRVAGFLCKALYRWRLGVEPLEPSLDLLQRQAYLADMFGFSAPRQPNDEPSAAVILSESFFNEDRLPILLATSCGLARAESTYLPDKGMESFLDCSSLNCFSTELLVRPAQRRFTAFLKEKKLVLCLSPAELRKELSGAVLDTDRLIAFLQWYREINRSPTKAWKMKADRVSLLKHVFFTIGHDGELLRCLRNTKFFADPSLEGLPCPTSCLPLPVANAFSSSTLESKSFLGLQRMDFGKWLAQFLLGFDQQRATRGGSSASGTTSQVALHFLESPVWSPAILSAISKHYSSLSSMLNRTQLDRVWRLLKSTRCIPCCQKGSTDVTMTLPAEATIPAEHFATEQCLFVALDISDECVVDAVILSSDDEAMEEAMEDVDAIKDKRCSVSRALLKKLGVRLYPALDSYLLATERAQRTGESAHAAMVRRLSDFAKMGADMTEDDLTRVRELPFLSCILAGTSEEVVCSASECYWLGKRAPQSVQDIALLLHLPLVRLDRAEHPKLVRFLVDRLKVPSTIRQADLINGAMSDKSSDKRVAERCVYQLFASFSPTEYKREKGSKIPFLFGEDGELHAPAESYLQANPFGCVVGESVRLLAEEHEFDLTNLGVSKEPNATDVIARLEVSDRPLLVDLATSVAVLEYLASREDAFSSKELKAIGKLPFLPVKKGSTLEYVCPANLLLKQLEDGGDDVEMEEVDCERDSQDEQSGSSDAPWDDILPMVDLGSAEAHRFLHKCGAVYEPTPEYILRKLMDAEVRQAYFESEKWSSRKYLGMLEYVASRFSKLPKSLHEPMRVAPFLLAYRDNAVISEGRIVRGQATAYLVTADTCYFGGCRVWTQHLNALHVPYGASDALQSMYEALGTRDVTVAAKQLTSAIRPFRITERSEELQQRIRSRAPLLLHSKNGRPLSKLKKNAESLLRGIRVQEAAAIDVALQLANEEPVNISTCDDRFVCSVQVEGGQATLFTPAGKEVVYLEVGNQLALLTSKGADLDERGGLYCAILGGDLGGLEYMGFVQVSKVREEEKIAREEESSEEVPAQRETDRQQRSARLRQRERIRQQAHKVISSNTLSKFFSRSQPFVGDRVGKSSHSEVRAAGDMDHMDQCVTQSELIRTSRKTKAGGLTLFVAHAKDEATVMDGRYAQNAFEAFGELLQELWGVIPTSPLEMFHVYYDTSTPLAAFNTSGSLFFSLVKFQNQLHSGLTRHQLLSFWFTVLCHELAHNIESAHNKNHEAAMEQLITAFLPALSESLGSRDNSTSAVRYVQPDRMLAGQQPAGQMSRRRSEQRPLQRSARKAQAGGKGKAETVVDLLSDDEEEEESKSLAGSLLSYFLK